MSAGNDSDGLRPFSDASYEEYLAEEKLMGCTCSTCGKTYCPPRPICPACADSKGLEWREMPRKGRLAAFTSITVPTPDLAAEGFGRDKPLWVGVVELEAGTRVDARLLGFDGVEPGDVSIGMEMELEFVDAPGGRGKLPAFRPVKDCGSN